MNTLRYLIFKCLVKRSPRSTRAGVIETLARIDSRSVAEEFDYLLTIGYLKEVPDGKRTIVRISTDARQRYPNEIATIQWELDNEK